MDLLLHLCYILLTSKLQQEVLVSPLHAIRQHDLHHVGRAFIHVMLSAPTPTQGDVPLAGQVIDVAVDGVAQVVSLQSGGGWGLPGEVN